MTSFAILGTAWVGLSACNAPGPAGDAPATSPPSGRFGSDLAFLKQHTEVVVLTDPSGAEVAVAPAYQGRVMTSTTGGSDAPSFGWLGRAAIESGKNQPHMNVFGGEDRFWLGPEGGQFALYFKPGDPFDLDALADAGAVRLGQVGCREPDSVQRELSQADVARELLPHRVRDRRGPDRPAAAGRPQRQPRSASRWAPRSTSSRTRAPTP